MTERYVFDTEAVVAFLYDEPGAERVATLLAAAGNGDVNGFLAETNASETYYLVARFEGTAEDRPTPESLRLADRDIRALTRQGLSVERADWRLAGEVKAGGSLSLADAHAVALAHEREATLVVGGDEEFEEAPVDVDIERFRTHGV